MKIYHGTNAEYLGEILRNGIKPRKLTGKDNWKHQPKEYQSVNNAVYLTTAYPLYFATATSDNLQLLVLEIDFDKLDKEKVFPDEDFLAQVLSRQKNFTLKISHKTIKKAGLSCFQNYWEMSLKKMGTCCYMGTIEPKLITRYAVINSKIRKQLLFSMLDPSICLENYLIRGQFYENFVKWIFGDIKELPQLSEAQENEKIISVEDTKEAKGQLKKMFTQQIEFWTRESKNRDGIEVVELQKEIK
jgi:hypothetical protein